MMRGLLIFFLLCAAACSQAPSAPRDVLSMDQMKLITYDLIRAEEYQKNFVPVTGTSSPGAQQRKEQAKVFALHKVTAASFFASYRYYQSQPALQKLLFDSLHAFSSRKVRTVKRPYPVKS